MDEQQMFEALKKHHKEHHDREPSILELQRTADKRLELLRRVEWVDMGPDAVFPEPKIWKQCQICCGWIEDGHADDCELARIIA